MDRHFADMRVVSSDANARQLKLGYKKAVVVDLPVDLSTADRTLGPAGIVLGGDPGRSLLNTATFISHTNWETGEPIRTAQPIGVDLRMLYRYISGTQGEQRPSFNRLLLNVLIGIGVLLLVIEVVALGNGVALARSITAAVDDLFQGTERVTRGEFGQPIAVRSDDQLGRLSASFNHMTSRIRELLVEQDELYGRTVWDALQTSYDNLVAMGHADLF